MKKILLALATFMLVSSCKATKKTLGLTENMPDEFQVHKAKPLEVPPHFSLSQTNQLKTTTPPKNKLSEAEEALIKESAQK